MQIIVYWACCSVDYKCLNPWQVTLFYHLSSDRWLQYVESLWAHLGFAAPPIPWYWCCGSPVESKGPNKLESRRLWVDLQWQQHFHNALLLTQQLCCVAGKVLFSFTVMLKLQYLIDWYCMLIIYLNYTCIINLSGGAWIFQPYTYVCKRPPPCGLCKHLIASPLPLHHHHYTYTTPQVL